MNTGRLDADNGGLGRGGGWRVHTVSCGLEQSECVSWTRPRVSAQNKTIKMQDRQKDWTVVWTLTMAACEEGDG